MDFDFILPFLYSLLTNGFFWVVSIVFILILSIVILKVKQKRKFKIPVLILTPLGNNKFGITETKAGWFKRHRKLKNLIELGQEDELVTKNWSVISGSTPADYHEFNHKRCLIVTPSLDDPDILFPISQIEYTDFTKGLLLDFPPIEIREAAVDGYKKTVVEMKDFKEQLVQYVLVGLFFIIVFLCIIFITQYGKHMANISVEAQRDSIQTNGIIAERLERISNSLGNLANKPAIETNVNPYNPAP
jgi:hypothetical protein